MSPSVSTLKTGSRNVCEHFLRFDQSALGGDATVCVYGSADQCWPGPYLISPSLLCLRFAFLRLALLPTRNSLVSMAMVSAALGVGAENGGAGGVAAAAHDGGRGLRGVDAAARPPEWRPSVGSRFGDAAEAAPESKSSGIPWCSTEFSLRRSSG